MASRHKLSVTVQEGIRNFSYTGGIKHYAHKDDIELQAQDGNLHATARQDIHITSTEGKILITSPKELSIKVAGSELKINEQGVFITTPHTFRVKSEEKEMVGGERVGFGLPVLPKLGEYYLHFVMKNEHGKPLSGKQYILYNKEGEMIETGVLDEEGRTSVLHDRVEKGYYIHVVNAGFDEAESDADNPKSNEQNGDMT